MRFRYLASTAALTLLSVAGFACKGGGSDPTGTFLTVEETIPEDGEPGAPVETRIAFLVSEPIDEASLTNDTFFVTDGNGDRVPGTPVVVDENPNAAEILLDVPLSVITDFTITITGGVRSTGGRSLESDFAWGFRTVDSEWGDSEWIEEVAMGISREPEIGVDRELSAIAAWEYTTANGDQVWANRYTRANIWGTPERIDDAEGSTADMALAVDGLGNGYAVWEQTPPNIASATIWVNRYDIEQLSWGTPELLQRDELTRSVNPAVAGDPNGSAIAVWGEIDEITGDQLVWARRWEAGSGWGAQEVVGEEDPITEFVQLTRIDTDDSGNAIAVWSRQTTGGDVLLANRYAAGQGWGTPQLIKPDPDTAVDGVRLGVGAGGDAFVVWTQLGETRDDIWAVRWSGSTWETPARIDDYDVDSKTLPDVAVDGTGVAHAVWAQFDPDFRNIWASQYTPGSGWGAPELIEPPNEDPQDDADATNPRISTNSAGNTFVVWLQNWRNWSSVWTNRLDPGTGWMTAERIETLERPARSQAVAVDEGRHAHAVWAHGVSSGIDWVRTNRFE